MKINQSLISMRETEYLIRNYREVSELMLPILKLIWKEVLQVESI